MREECRDRSLEVAHFRSHLPMASWVYTGWVSASLGRSSGGYSTSFPAGQATTVETRFRPCWRALRCVESESRIENRRLITTTDEIAHDLDLYVEVVSRMFTFDFD